MMKLLFKICFSLAFCNNGVLLNGALNRELGQRYGVLHRLTNPSPQTGFWSPKMLHKLSFSTCVSGLLCGFLK